MWFSALLTRVLPLEVQDELSVSLSLLLALFLGIGFVIVGVSLVAITRVFY